MAWMCCHVHVANGKLTKCYIYDMRRLYDKAYNKRFFTDKTLPFSLSK